MDLIMTTAALILVLCSQIQITGALPVRRNLANYQPGASGKGKQGSFLKEAVSADTSNERPPCQVVPDDDPLNATPPPPISVDKPGQKLPPPPPPPPPRPPPVLYQPIMPHYVLQYPVRGGSYYVHGQGAGQRPPHSPVGASGFLPAPQWFLDLQRDKRLPVVPRGNPAGSQRGPLLVQRSQSTSSETSSAEDGD